MWLLESSRKDIDVDYRTLSSNEREERCRRASVYEVHVTEDRKRRRRNR